MFKKFILNKIENVQSRELEDFLSRMQQWMNSKRAEFLKLTDE